MQLQDNRIKLSLFIAAAAALNIVESILPHPVPWVRLGLANMVTLVSIICMGRAFALKVAAGRVIVSSVIMGTFLSPGFYLSVSGTAVSTIMMCLLYRPIGRLGVVGVSVAGAVSHSTAQLAAAYLLFVPYPEVFIFLPLTLVAASVSGIITGYLSMRVAPAIAEYSDKRIYLASTSERRIGIMKRAGLPFIIVDPEVDEDAPVPGEKSKDYAVRQAEKKLEAVMDRLTSPGLVIAADTVVEAGNEILGKPSNVEDAARMLKKLSGNSQRVYTGVAAADLKTRVIISDAEMTVLKMKGLGSEDIEYLKDKNLDKAGGYGIQGMKDRYFNTIKGSYTNIVGFPVSIVRSIMRRERRAGRLKV